MKTQHQPRQIFERPAQDREFIGVTELQDHIRKRPIADIGEFHPGKPFYNQDGDMIEVYWSDEPCYAECLGDITVERSFETKQIVGIKIHGVTKLAGLKRIE